MSKIFVIRGQFKRGNVWVDQGFFGYIKTEGNSSNFKGYCKQVFSEDSKEPKGVRFILGSFAQRETGQTGASLIKAINEPQGWPTLYYTPNIDSEEGSYYFWMGPAIGWTKNSEAKIRIFEMPYSEKIDSIIEETFRSFDLENPKNREMQKTAYLCESYAKYGV